MRRLLAAILVSVTGHAVALGWVVSSGSVLAVPLRQPAGTPLAAAPASPPPALEPISVVLFDVRREPMPPARSAAPDPPPAGAVISTATAGSRTPHGEAANAGTARGPGQPHGEPARSPWMTMRGPERPRAGLSSDFIDDFLSHSRPLAPPPDIPGERIADELAEAHRQLRHAERNGSSNAGVLRQQIVALNERRAAEELAPAGGGTYQADKQTFAAKVDADGQVHFQDKRGELDTQDKMMLLGGIDPYARGKLALLDRTRDQRAAVGERHRRVQLAHATELMRNNVEQLWATTRDLAARKLGLFELWDDCAETGSEDLVSAGAAARAFVIGVIRARLRGGDAYSAAELARLNAHRRSTAAFAPYD